LSVGRVKQEGCGRSTAGRAGTAAKGRGRSVPTGMDDMTLHVEGLRWHGPDHASRGAPVVGAPSHSYGYGVVAPTDAIAREPRSWDCGIPGTRTMARVAAHRTPSAALS